MISSTVFTGLWGSGTGPAKRLQSQTRIMIGVLLGAATLALPLTSLPSVVFATLAVALWCMLAGMSGRVALWCAGIALVLFLPIMLITPWMTVDSATSDTTADRLWNAGTIGVRSTCCLFVSAATIVALPLDDVHYGITRIPIPRSLSLLIVQIITQTMLLLEETLRVIAVLRLRTGSHFRGYRVLFAFSITWMARILFKAERNAAAMTVRGYGTEAAEFSDDIPLPLADILALTVASLALALSIILRLRGLL